jgi:hypothetical protein
VSWLLSARSVVVAFVVVALVAVMFPNVCVPVHVFPWVKSNPIAPVALL